jgi:hypothetical protein
VVLPEPVVPITEMRCIGLPDMDGDYKVI